MLPQRGQSRPGSTGTAAPVTQPHVDQQHDLRLGRRAEPGLDGVQDDEEAALVGTLGRLRT